MSVDEPYNGLTATSTDSSHFMKRHAGREPAPLQIPDNTLGVMAVYDDPSDYFRHSPSMLSPNFSPTKRIRSNSSNVRLPNYSQTSMISHSPTNTMSDNYSNATPDTSIDMSRDPSICGAFSMMRVKSHTSNSSLPRDAVSRNIDVYPAPKMTQHLETSSYNHSFPTTLPYNVSNSAYSFPTSEKIQPQSLPFISEAMTRSCTSESASSSKSRVSQRAQEVVLSARAIQPKVQSSSTMSRGLSSSSSAAHDMSRACSSDGSKISIPKNRGYVRPTRDKVMCHKCNVKPEGYRGPHELRRHLDVMHPGEKRKAFVCVDRSPDKMFLAKCKSCQGQKKYHAEYNAAAHLRRIHFNPKEKGVKGKKEARPRGGDGGGDYPRMEILRLWLEEVEEVVADKTPFTQTQGTDENDIDEDNDQEEQEEDDHDHDKEDDDPVEREAHTKEEHQTAEVTSGSNVYPICDRTLLQSELQFDFDISTAYESKQSSFGFQSFDESFNELDFSLAFDNPNDLSTASTLPVAGSNNNLATISNAPTSTTIIDNAVVGNADSINLSLSASMSHPLDDFDLAFYANCLNTSND